VSFFALAAYITVESLRALLGGESAEHSTVGIVLAAISLVVMPAATARRSRVGVSKRGSRLEADAALHLSIRRPSDRPTRQFFVWLVLG
jgi:divalent metal cation (Fe/Co/Zn/Cd) transporter